MAETSAAVRRFAEALTELDEEAWKAHGLIRIQPSLEGAIAVALLNLPEPTVHQAAFSVDGGADAFEVGRTEDQMLDTMKRIRKEVEEADPQDDRGLWEVVKSGTGRALLGAARTVGLDRVGREARELHRAFKEMGERRRAREAEARGETPPDGPADSPSEPADREPAPQPSPAADGGPVDPQGRPLVQTGEPTDEFQIMEKDQGPSPIGVPATVRGPGGQPVPFQAIRQRTLPGTQDILTSRGPAGDRGQPPSVLTRGVPPQYYDGHEKQPALFNIRSTEDKLRTQLALEEAGLLEEYSPGQWDENTWKAFRDVLEHANVNGLDWQTSLNQLVVANPPVDKDADRQKGRSGYMAPDYATLAQTAKQAVRQNLDREPEDWEVKLLADELGGGYQQQLTQQQQIDQDTREVAVGEMEPGETFTAVDPKARFAERFEELYQAELEAERREDEAQTNTQLLMRSISGMDRTVGA